MQQPGAPKLLDSAALSQLFQFVLERHEYFESTITGVGGQAVVYAAVLRSSASPELLAPPLAAALGLEESRLQCFLTNEVQSAVLKAFREQHQPDQYQLDLTADLTAAVLQHSTSPAAKVLCLPMGNFKSGGRYVEVLQRSLATWDALPSAVLQVLNFTHSAWCIYMVVDATCLLHKLGYAHMDLKASNLMMRVFHTGSTAHPYLLLPQVIDTSMADRQGSMVGAITGTKGMRVMDSAPRKPAGEVEVRPECDSPGVAHIILDTITAPAGLSSGPPKTHVLQQQQEAAAAGAQQPRVLQEVSVHTLLGDLQQLADSIPPSKQPQDEGQVAVLCALLMWTQGLLHHGPAPQPTQQRPDDDAAFPSSSFRLPARQQAAPGASAKQPALQERPQHLYQQLSALNYQLAQLLPAMQGPLAAMYAAMHLAIGSDDWLDVAAGRKPLLVDGQAITLTEVTGRTAAAAGTDRCFFSTCGQVAVGQQLLNAGGLSFRRADGQTVFMRLPSATAAAARAQAAAHKAADAIAQEEARIVAEEEAQEKASVAAAKAKQDAAALAAAHALWLRQQLRATAARMAAKPATTAAAPPAAAGPVGSMLDRLIGSPGQLVAAIGSSQPASGTPAAGSKRRRSPEDIAAEMSKLRETAAGPAQLPFQAYPPLGQHGVLQAQQLAAQTGQAGIQQPANTHLGTMQQPSCVQAGTGTQLPRPAASLAGVLVPTGTAAAPSLKPSANTAGASSAGLGQQQQQAPQVAGAGARASGPPAPSAPFPYVAAAVAPTRGGHTGAAAVPTSIQGSAQLMRPPAAKPPLWQQQQGPGGMTASSSAGVAALWGVVRPGAAAAAAATAATGSGPAGRSIQGPVLPPGLSILLPGGASGAVSGQQLLQLQQLLAAKCTNNNTAAAPAAPTGSVVRGMPAMQRVMGNPAAATVSMPGSSGAAGLCQWLVGGIQQPQGVCSFGTGTSTSSSTCIQGLYPQQQLTPAARTTAALSGSACRPKGQVPAQRPAHPSAASTCDGSQLLPLQQGSSSTSTSSPHLQQQQQPAGQIPAEPAAALLPCSSLLSQQQQQPAGPLLPVFGAARWYMAVYRAGLTLEDLQTAVGELMQGLTGGPLSQPVFDSSYKLTRGVSWALLACCKLPGATSPHAAATQLRLMAADVCVGLLLEHADKQAGSSVPSGPCVEQLYLPTSSSGSGNGSGNSSGSSAGSGASPQQGKHKQKQTLPGDQKQQQHRVSWCPLSLEDPHKALQEPTDAQMQQLAPVPGTKVLRIRLDWIRREKKEAEQRLWEAAAAMYLYQQQVEGGANGWGGGRAWGALKQRVQLHAPAAREAASRLASELGAMPGRLVSEMQCSE